MCVDNPQVLAKDEMETSVTKLVSWRGTARCCCCWRTPALAAGSTIRKIILESYRQKAKCKRNNPFHLQLYIAKAKLQRAWLPSYLSLLLLSGLKPSWWWSPEELCKLWGVGCILVVADQLLGFWCAAAGSLPSWKVACLPHCPRTCSPYSLRSWPSSSSWGPWAGEMGLWSACLALFFWYAYELMAVKSGSLGGLYRNPTSSTFLRGQCSSVTVPSSVMVFHRLRLMKGFQAQNVTTVTLGSALS